MSGQLSGLSNAAQVAYDLAFQVSPIILQNGIATNTFGGMLPIISLTGQVASFILATSTTGNFSADNFFARYLPVPGGTLISNSVGMYPFANQQVAANAIIQQPLQISLLMIAPVNQTGGYLTKLPLLTALQSSLTQHNQLGGTYNIATPAYIYTNCLMTGMTDVTNGESRQVQIEWQMDFVQPLLTKAQAAAAQSSLIQTVSNGSQITGTPSWSGSAINAPSGVAGLPASVTQFLAQPAL